MLAHAYWTAKKFNLKDTLWTDKSVNRKNSSYFFALVLHSQQGSYSNVTVVFHTFPRQNLCLFSYFSRHRVGSHDLRELYNISLIIIISSIVLLFQTHLCEQKHYITLNLWRVVSWNSNKTINAWVIAMSRSASHLSRIISILFKHFSILFHTYDHFPDFSRPWKFPNFSRICTNPVPGS